jgi:hypothetical protein
MNFFFRIFFFAKKMKVVYFQGNNASFEEYRHHLIDSNLFTEDQVLKPDTDLNDIKSVPSCCVFTWFYTFAFDFFRKYVLGLPKIPIYWLAFWNASIGGQSDLKAMEERSKLTKEDVLYYGVSRGALVVARFCCHNQELKNVKGIILEGCPFSIRDVIKDKVPHFLFDWFLSVLECCTKYNRIQEHENHDWICDIPCRIPILIISSTGDKIVPSMHAHRLFDALKDQKRQVYLLMLENVGHNHFASSPLFQNIVPLFIHSPTSLGESRIIMYHLFI